MTFQLALFLYLFIGLAAMFVLFSLFHIYHLVRFGPMTITNFLIMISYSAISLAILYYAWTIIAVTDWSVAIIVIPTLQSPTL